MDQRVDCSAFKRSITAEGYAGLDSKDEMREAVRTRF